MLQGGGPCLPQSLWGEAVAAATYIRNRCPTKGAHKDSTPFEIFYGRKPDVSHLRTWGCMSTVLIHQKDRTKFGSKTYDGVLVGYGTSQKGYRIYDPKTHTTKVCRDVRFLEDKVLDSPSPNTDEDSFVWPEDWFGDESLLFLKSLQMKLLTKTMAGL